MFKKPSFWILLVIVLAGIGGGIYYYIEKSKAAEASAEADSTLQTAVASQGDLTILATGTGSIVPAKQINLGFDEAGTLLELNVQEGDEVTAGQLLARLQTAQSEETIASTIAEKELAVVQAQNALDNLFKTAEVSRTEALNNIATYSQEVRDAQYTMENYTMPVYLQGLETVEAVEKMKAELDVVLEKFEPYRYYPKTDDTRQDLLELLNEAQARYDAAVDRLNKEYVLEVAEANLTKAQQDYEKYKDGPAADELAEAQGTLANAQAKLTLAKAEKSVLELTAPFDGTVLAADAIVGGTVGEESIITLGDLDPLTLEVYLDESDLQMVVVGYPVEVIFDAYPDLTLTGKVTQISKSLQSVSDVEAIKALVQIDEEGLDPSQSLPVGLSATVDVIAGRATNAVLVPIEALRDLGDGEYAVFVVVDGQPEMRMVEVGLMDATSAEIKSGLQAGEVVSTGETQVQ